MFQFELSVVKLLLFHVQITNSKLKSIILHCELLTQSRLILEIQLYFCNVPFEGHQDKTSVFVGHTLNKFIFASLLMFLASNF